jgi:hypothetical protein
MWIKKAGIGLAVFFVAMVTLGALVDKKAPQQTVQPVVNEAAPSDGIKKYSKEQLESILEIVKGDASSLDAIWQDENLPVLLVATKDDGSIRDGLADYFCTMIAEKGVMGGRVHIMDYDSMSRHEWKKLGSAWCPE